MKKVKSLSLLALLCIAIILPQPVARGANYSICLTDSRIVRNDTEVRPEGYNINGHNYFKLRDVAHITNDSTFKFEIYYNAANNLIEIDTANSYTKVGGELVFNKQDKLNVCATSSRLMIDGWEVYLDAYNINDYNYYKLRDLGEYLDFGVYWDEEIRTVYIDTRLNADLAEKEEIARQVERPRQEELARQEALARQEKLAEQEERARQEALARQEKLARQEEAAKQEEAARQEEIAKQEKRAMQEEMARQYELERIEQAELERKKEEEKRRQEELAELGYGDEVFRLTNIEREKNGLAPFVLNKELNDLANIKARDMHDNNYISHNSPTYGSPPEMMLGAGIKFGIAAENIGGGYFTPQAVVDGWMSSPGHRSNILYDTLTDIGIGYFRGEYGRLWVQMFTGPAGG